jgi:hypothetical protein
LHGGGYVDDEECGLGISIGVGENGLGDCICEKCDEKKLEDKEESSP